MSAARFATEGFRQAVEGCPRLGWTWSVRVGPAAFRAGNRR